MQGPYMISWAEAQAEVISRTRPLTQEPVAVEQAVGRILGSGETSPVDMPPFDNSAMDGYAIRWSDPLPEGWTVTGAIPAGHPSTRNVGAGEAMRIFTGAPLPPGADTIIQQEWVRLEGDQLELLNGQVVKGAHVRGRGTQIRQGEEALSAGTLLTPGAIGFLANLGIGRISVFRRPVVRLLVTGSELVKPGHTLGPGQIFESNSHTLIAALDAAGIRNVQAIHVPDDPDRFDARFHEAVEGSDLVIMTGGISVGDHDIVRDFMEGGSVTSYFYKVRQRPGKPLFFGAAGQTLLFALPGNPASVMSCWYQYVLPALRLMQGFTRPFLDTVRRPLTHRFVKKPGLTFFLKALATDDGVTPLEGQLSYIMRSFATANAVIRLEEDRESVEAGEVVDVHLLGHGHA